MICGIHYFITKLKTKIDDKPRSRFNTFNVGTDLMAESDVYIGLRQILTSQVDPRTEKIKYL